MTYASAMAMIPFVRAGHNKPHVREARRGCALLALLATFGCMPGLPSNTPDDVRGFVHMSFRKQADSLASYPAAMRASLACASWRHVHPVNLALVHALAAGGCDVLPGLGSAFEEEQGELSVNLLAGALAEMRLEECDSVLVAQVVRAASIRITRMTVGDWKREAERSLKKAERGWNAY